MVITLITPEFLLVNCLLAAFTSSKQTLLYIVLLGGLYFLKNWGKIALQGCVGFCCIMQISYNYTYITSLLSLPPFPLPHSSRSLQNTRLGSLCYTATSHQLSVLHMGCVCVCVCVCCVYWCYFLHSSTLFFLHCVHKSILNIWLSVPSLQIDLSIPFSYIPYIYIY